VIRQYYAQRFRHLYPPKPVIKGSVVTYVADPRDKPIGNFSGYYPLHPGWSQPIPRDHS
jgi:hypothetical protein